MVEFVHGKTAAKVALDLVVELARPDALDALARRPKAGRSAATAVLLLALATPAIAHADDPVAIGRGDYQAALDASDPVTRSARGRATAASLAVELRARSISRRRAASAARASPASSRRPAVRAR